MKKLLNTLYVLGEDRYLSLDGENIVVLCGRDEIGRVPLHNIEAVAVFGFSGASPALMGALAERGIDLSFMSPSGKFLARVCGKERGNVLLRRKQYRIADDENQSICIARNFIAGKLYNSRWVLERAARDYPMRLDAEKLKEKADMIGKAANRAYESENADSLRGIEGEAASNYFSVFDELILQQKEDFYFNGRNKRPPLDNVNAMLSFAYTLLSGMCAAGLEAVGLDPYVGFFHTDRPGRISLALDLMEELRPVFADRFVITAINKRLINGKDFIKKEDGAVLFTENGKKTFLKLWQERKQEEIRHPFLDEKIQWGLVPYVQALLLARHLRGDLDEYPSFMWK
jgi:CRISPR-associated protein Cas1